jgi:hypothetical protein
MNYPDAWSRRKIDVLKIGTRPAPPEAQGGWRRLETEK